MKARGIQRFGKSAVAAAVILIAAVSGLAQTPAFPGALGFGANATGGRNGTVYHVTTLADSGTGSFRTGVSSGNRTIVFDVGGEIKLASAVTCSGGLTIAGQTAPGGIVFDGGEISFASRSNIICRFIRVRPGSDTASHTDDCISLYRARDAILDHVSMEFGPWNNLDAVSDDWQNWPVTDVTFQHCLNANPSKNVTGDSTPGQQFGAHTESVSSDWTWCYSIFANSHNRNPLSKVNDVFINNVLYNCSAGYTTHTSTDFNHDIVNNYFVAGPAYSSSSDFPWYQVDNNQSIYYSGNYKDVDLNGTLAGTVTTPYWYQGGSGGTVLASPWSAWTSIIPTVSADLAWRYDISAAGAFPRDEVDALVISQMKTIGSGTVGTGAGTAGPNSSLYSDQTQTGLGNNGYGTLTGLTPPTDSDNDGMPDYWELATGSSPNAANPLTNTISGYTLLENYLNWLAAPHAVTRTNTPVDLNLVQFASGFSASATFSVNNATNGTVTLLNSTNAHFIPTANFSGLGTFNFTVTDGGMSLNALVTICVTPVAPPASATQFNGALIGVTVATASLPSNLTWRGDGTANTWNTTVSNWFNGSGLAAFKNNDAVTLDDTGSDSPAINLSLSVAPTSFTVDSSKNYTVGGNGLLTGTMSLTKSGTGSLIINTTNSFSGPVAINDGTLELGTTTGAGSGTITLNGGTLSLKAPGGPATYNNPVVIASPATVFVPGSGNSNQRLSGAITGGAVWNISASGGTLSLAGSMSGFSGSVVMTNSGTLRWYGSSGSSSASFDLGAGSATMFARDGGTITLGSLTGGANTFLKGAGSSAVATTYVIGGGNASTTFAGQITNGTFAGTPITTAITKTGTGTLTLSGTNYHSGSTSVTNGTLVVNGSITASAVTASTAGTLAGTGYLGGLTTISGGGKLSPGNGTAGTITFGGGLTLSGGIVNFDFASDPTVGSGVNDLISLNGGTLTLSGTTTITPNFLNGLLTNGTYTLIAGGASTSGSTANLLWTGPSGTRQTIALDTSTVGALLLKVSGTPAANLIWRGTNSANWDTSTLNWFNGSAADTFYNLDRVLFDDSGSNALPVNLTTTLSPGNTQINATRNYIFSGPGALSGSGALTKTGSGTLTVSTTNSGYAGSILLSGGTLAANAPSCLGSGALTISNAATLALPASGTFFFGGSVTIPANTTGNISSSALGNGLSGNLYSGGSGSVLNLSSGVSFGGTTSAQFDNFTGTINIPSGATLRYSANSSGNLYGSLNPVLVINGMLQPRNGGNTVQLGSFSGSGTLAGTQSSSGGAGDTLYVIGGNNTDSIFSGIISSNVAVAGCDVLVSKIGTGTLTLSGASTYAGGTTVTAGTLRVNNTVGSGTGTGDLEIYAGATLTGKGTIGSVTTIDDGATLAPGDPTGTLTFTSGLSLTANSILQFALGTNSDAVTVSGDLLASGYLNVANAGGFGVGVYTLFTCAGALTLDSLVLASAPAGYNYSFNTNTPGLVKLVVAPTGPPSFAGTALSGTNLIFSGSNGVPLASYYVLTTTNLTLPLANWTRASTNQFDSRGYFSFTNSIGLNSTRAFYSLQGP